MLFGILKAHPDSVENYIILIAKYYIWSNKFQTPMAPLSMNVYKKVLRKRLIELEGVATLLNDNNILEKWDTVRLLLQA